MPFPHHPDAQLFPMMSETELLDLATDIAATELHEAIKLDPAGEFIVDGRNREAACGLAGVEPRYERLPAGTDIFAYVVSVNLRRRHLTVEQRHQIINEIKRRNPEISNREIAKRADVSYQTVNNVLSCPPDKELSPGQKTKGGDGKSYPKTGKYSAEQKDEIMAAIQTHRGMPERELAAQIGVSHGTVQRYRREMDGMTSREARREHGRPAAGVLRPAKPASASIAESIERRKNLKPFELTREEKGMGSAEYGAEQHPDYPPGWTRDHVHREKYGRIQIYTPAQLAEQELVKRFHAVVVALKTIAETGPDADELDCLSYDSLDGVEVQLEKFGPRVLDLIPAYRARIKSRKAPKLTVVKP